MADMLTRRHGSDVFEMSNRATLQTIDAASLPGITARMDNHESGSNPNAHGVQNIGGLQGILDGKANTIHAHAIADVTNLGTELSNKANKSMVTQNVVVVTGVDFTLQTVTTTTIKIVDGIIVEII